MLSAAVFFGLLGSPLVQQGPVDHRGLMIAVMLMTFAIGFGGVAIAGHWSNYNDLSAK